MVICEKIKIRKFELSKELKAGSQFILGWQYSLKLNFQMKDKKIAGL
jgi:hypothetical protein